VSGKAKTLDALTGLRFIAALAVFVHHITGRFGIAEVKGPMGNLAVSFFFVLSGFILTYVYHDRLKWGGVRKFYFTRWARIWPLHMVCLALLLGFAYNLRVFDQEPERWSMLVANVFLVQSWVPDTGYVFSFNGVSWSISVEMFFYLMFPLFLLGGQKQFWFKYVGLLLLTAGLVVGLTMVSHTNWLPDVNFMRVGHNNPLLRLPEFCTGMAVGFIYLNREKVKSAMTTPRPRSFAFDTFIELITCAAIVGQPMLLRKYRIFGHIKQAEWGGVFPATFLQFTSGCFLFAGVIYVFSKSNGLIARLCSTRAMVFLGEVSFAFYMIHPFVIRMISKKAEFYGELPPVMVGIAVGMLSLAASTVLFKVVEMPSKNGLLSMYDGKWMKGLATVPKAAFDFARTGLCIWTVMLLVVPLIVLNQYKSNVASTSAIQKIVAQTDPLDPRPSGWAISLAWRKRSEFEHARYVHVCDQVGNVVGYGSREEDRFRDANPGDQIVDKFFLSKKIVEGGSTIGIGFHGVGIGMMNVDRGPRSMRNRRLDLIQVEDLPDVLGQRSVQGE